MIKAKHILTTEQTPDRLYIPPTIEIVEVEEECALAGGSPIDTTIPDSENKTGDGDMTPPSAKGNYIFFYDDLPENANEDNLDY